MGIVKKSQIAKYWSRNVLTETPYFGKTMMRHQFLLIMKNLHLVNNMFDDKSDELFKICPFVKMCDENFKYVYTCKLSSIRLSIYSILELYSTRYCRDDHL